jgi:chromosome partitioning protein
MNLATQEAGFIVSIITIATTKGGAGKTTLARLILGHSALSGLKTAALDADFNHTLTDWVTTAAKHPITVRHELDETKIVPVIGELHNAHDVVVIDTAGAASQSTIFAIGCADVVLVPIAPSSADIVEAIKTINLIKSASQMLGRQVTARVVLTAVQPGTNIADHIEKEVAKAKLPVLDTRLHRLVAYQEMSFTGIPPTTGLAGIQCTNFLLDIEALGGLPQTTKLAS